MLSIISITQLRFVVVVVGVVVVVVGVVVVVVGVVVVVVGVVGVVVVVVVTVVVLEVFSCRKKASERLHFNTRYHIQKQSTVKSI